MERPSSDVGGAASGDRPTASPPRRPWYVTGLAVLYAVGGCMGVVMGARPVVDAMGHAGVASLSRQEVVDASLAFASGLIALAGAALAWRGVACSRWILVAWMGFHVALGLFHELDKLLVHAALLALTLWGFLTPAARAFFRPRGVQDGPANEGPAE